MKKKILNVGCGNDTYGTHFIDFYPAKPKVVKCDVNKERFPFPDNYFDEVYSKYLFEHLNNFSHFLKEARRVLKKSGTLVIITDNAGFWGIFGKVHHGGYEKRSIDKVHEEDKHYALFTPNHLVNWLNLANFKNIKVNYYIDEEVIFLKKHLLWIKIISFFTKRFSPQIKAVCEK